jgi:hypothetical protein
MTDFRVRVLEHGEELFRTEWAADRGGRKERIARLFVEKFTLRGMSVVVEERGEDEEREGGFPVRFTGG